MPDCQSGAVHSVACGTIIYIAVAGDVGVCHADCHAVSCRKALYDMGCSSVLSARLFPDERDGRRLAQENEPSGGVAAGQRSLFQMPRRAEGSVGIHHRERCDRASYRMLIALGDNHPLCGVAF